MATDTTMLYKLMILYMLSRADFSLANAQITDFILEKGYTNYFNVQQALNDLQETGLIYAEGIRNRTFYHLCPDGRDTLNAFAQRIPATIREDIDTYFSTKRYQLMGENEITADYHEERWDSYVVTCEIRDKDEVIAAVRLNVTDEDTAAAVCRNWQDHNQEIYNYLMMRLITGGPEE